MIRRALLLAPLCATAQDGFAPTRPNGLRLHGVAARRYLGFRVYEAALYLATPATRQDQAVDPALIHVRYLHRITLADVRRAWVASLGELAPDFDAWLRPIAAGEEESFGFRAGAAFLEGPGRAPRQLAPGPAATALRASWLGGTAPAALTRGWFPAA